MSSILFWSVVAACGAVQAFIIVTALRMRVTSDPSRGFLGARPAEVLWTLLPALLLIALLVLSYQVFRTPVIVPA